MKKIILKLLFLIIITLLIEVCIFNFRFLQTLNYEEFKPSDIITSDGLSYIGDNNYEILNSKNVYVEILNINKSVKNIHLDINAYNEYGDPSVVNISLFATDKAHELYYKLPNREIISSTPKSLYLNLNLAGDSEKLKIQINADEGNVINLNSITLNNKVPLFISVLRIIVIFFGLSIIYIIRPGSKFYKYKIKADSACQKFIVLILILIQVIFFAFLSGSNPEFVKPVWEHHQMYQKLAVSLSKGQVYLEEEPPLSLIQMDNPYDKDLRKQVMNEADENYLWDAAYYDGKYYVYFGIVPELIFYFPCYMLFNQDFSTYNGIFITGIFFIIAVFGLLNQLIKRWFRNTPFVLYLVLSIMFINCCGVMYMIARPDFYSLPIIMGVTFSLLGLYFWISYLNDKDKKDKKDKRNFRALKLLMGSLCMALVAGCRPQLLLGSFLAVPLFWQEVLKRRRLLSIQNIKNVLCFCLPYLVIAAGIMYYNYIRFDSVFDFGANYNLTTNDMTNRGFKLGRIPLGIFMYLFQFPVITTDFPFISTVNFNTSYLGLTIYENMFGGIIAGNIFLYSCFLIRTVKYKLKEKGAYIFSCLCGIFAIIIVVADTQMAGILFRYISDFGWLLFLCAVMVVLSLNEKLSNPKLSKYLILFIVISLISGTAYSILLNFSATSTSIYSTNPELFYNIKYLIQFWL